MGLKHPKIYQRVLSDTIEWAKQTEPPEYRPDWMINHGLNALSAALENTESPNPYRSNHDPEKNWESVTEDIEQFLDDRSAWEKLENK